MAPSLVIALKLTLSRQGKVLPHHTTFLRSIISCFSHWPYAMRLSYGYISSSGVRQALQHTLTSLHSLYVSIIMLVPRTEDFPMQPTQVHNSVAFTPTSYPIPSRARAQGFKNPPNKTIRYKLYKGNHTVSDPKALFLRYGIRYGYTTLLPATL